MSNEDIIAIIKWGPLALFLIIFLINMLSGMIKGRRKVTRRFIYFVLYTTLIFIFTPKICELLLNLEVNGMSVNGYVNDFINNNADFKNTVDGIPGALKLIKAYPSAIISLFMFLILMIVGLPLSFPIYIIYCIFYNAIYKKITKYSKYKRDENGKLVRNEKGKKIKLKHNKHRVSAGIIKGVEGVLATSIVLVPIGVITRLYQDATNASESGDLSNIEYLSKFKDVFEYVDAFNGSVIGKITNSKVNEGAFNYLTKIEIDGNKTSIEKELSNVVVAAVYIEESGIIDLLSKETNIYTLDLSSLKMDKLEKAIELLFDTTTLNLIVSDGVNYVMSNYLKDTLTELTNDASFIDKIKYANSDEVEKELLKVTSIVKDIINSRLLNIYQKNQSNLVGVVNEINVNDVETILNKVLSIKILSEAMPSVVNKLLKDYGLVSELTKDNNSDFVNLLVDVIKLVQSLEIENLDKLKEGNLLDNLVNVLYEDGAIKDNTIDALATLLARINSSRVFDEVLVTQLNNLLSQNDIKLNSQMIVNVNTKDEWKNELVVIENILEMYDLYSRENKVDFLMAKELLENVKNSKAMILAFPIAYQKLFPSIGIETDLSKIEYIDYSKENASEEEIEFYNYWKNEVVHLENIADEMARLEITSVSDLSLDLLRLESDVDSLSVILSEVFTSDLLKDGVEDLVDETLNEMLLEYEIVLNEGAVSGVNNMVNKAPYYIVDGENQYNIYRIQDKYYIGEVEVNIVDNRVNYNSKEYQVLSNSLKRVWKSELMNLSNAVDAIKTGEYTSKDNLTVILDSVDNMVLLNECKNDLLIYAVKQVGILDQDYIENLDKNKIDFSKEKTILLNIIDEYETLKDIASVDFATIGDDKITTLSNVLDEVLKSDIFGDYAADTIVDLAKEENINLESENVKNSTTWESDFKLIRTALNMTKDDFNEAKVTSLLADIKESSLLGPVKEEVLLNTVKQIGIEGITISDTLKPSDIDYDSESLAIISASRNLALVEDLAGMEVKDMDTSSISDLLASTINSKLFGDSVVEKLVTTFNSEGIKHDLDLTDNEELIKTIKSIDTKEKWENEFTIIKSLLEVDTKEEVNKELFANLENNSVLLSGCRANLLIRFIDEIAKNDTGLELSDVSVETLVGMDKKYTQYNREKDFLIKLVDLTDIDDISSIDDNNKGKVASALDAMKDSVVFDKEYNSLLTDMTKPIKDIDVGNDKTLSDWGITINENPTIESWETEIDSLLIISDNMEMIAQYDIDDAKNNTATIGVTLDALDNSSIISGTDKVAGKLVDNILGVEGTPITKDSDKTWKQTFDILLGNN